MKLLACLSACLLAGTSALAQQAAVRPASAIVSKPSTYTGPGDLNTYIEAYGTQALSAATRGTKLLNVCLPADVACADAVSDASTGTLVIPSPGGTACGTSIGVNLCTVKTAYSLTGSGHDATQATILNRPLLNTTGVNGHPTISCPGGTAVLSNAAIAFTAAPFTMVVAASRTTVVGFDSPFNAGDNTVDVVFNAGGGSAHFDAAGASPNATYTEGNFVSIIGTNDTTNTGVSLNGVSAGTNATGTTAIAVSIALCNATGGTNPLIGQLGFEGYIASSVSNQTAINAAIHQVWAN